MIYNTDNGEHITLLAQIHIYFKLTQLCVKVSIQEQGKTRHRVEANTVFTTTARPTLSLGSIFKAHDNTKYCTFVFFTLHV